MYIPDLGLKYDQKDPYVRMYHPTYDRVCKVDEHYPFIDNEHDHRSHRWGYAIVLYGIIQLILRIRSGMRIHGQEKLKQNKDLLKGGYITVGNHMHPHDAEAILIATRAHWTTKIPMFQKNFETKNQFFLKLVGGVPIPPAEEGMAAMKKFNEAFDYFHEQGWSFHIFPEMAKWPWYAYLRPFQKGAFTMSFKYGMPILPVVITYRERTGIYKLFGPKEEPLIDVTILDPITPQQDQPRKLEVDRLLTLTHERMCQAMHIQNNPWPPMPQS